MVGASAFAVAFPDYTITDSSVLRDQRFIFEFSPLHPQNMYPRLKPWRNNNNELDLFYNNEARPSGHSRILSLAQMLVRRRGNKFCFTIVTSWWAFLLTERHETGDIFPKPSKVVFLKGKKQVRAGTSCERSTTAAVCCFSATGRYVPSIMFPKGNGWMTCWRMEYLEED